MRGRAHRLSSLMTMLFVLFAGQNVRADFGASPEYKVVGYYTAWSIYGRGYPVTKVPPDKLTHINYAFANISADGRCVLGDVYGDTQFLYPGDEKTSGLHGNFNQLRLLKQKNPKLKTLISIGGWTWSDHFSDVALTEESRRRFAASCVNFMQDYGFDGIDVDWEFPVKGGLKASSGRPADKANFTLLLSELRHQLDSAASAGQHFLLTIAAPATAQFYQNMELDRIHVYVDWVNIMAYTFYGGWNKTTNLHAALYPLTDDPNLDTVMRNTYNVDGAVQAYLMAGVPPAKVVVGVPFYGHGWQGVPNVNNGLFQTFSGLPKGTWGDGIYDYKDLKAHYFGTYQRFWHKTAQVPWLYNPATGIMISYEDPESLGAKANYIMAKGLGGAMIWELDYDDVEHSLLNTLADRLGLK